MKFVPTIPIITEESTLKWRRLCPEVQWHSLTYLDYLVLSVEADAVANIAWQDMTGINGFFGHFRNICRKHQETEPTKIMKHQVFIGFRSILLSSSRKREEINEPSLESLEPRPAVCAPGLGKVPVSPSPINPIESHGTWHQSD